MDHRQIERRVAFLLPDRRADVASFEPDIKGYTFDRVIIDPHLNVMHARAWGLMHFGFHGVVADTSEPVDNGADDEMGAQIFGEAVEFVNVALSIANVNTPIRLPQQSDRLAEIIEPTNALLCFDRNPCRVYLPLELGSAFKLIAVPEFDRG